MNFAEKLINWRDNNQELQKCEKTITDQIKAKVKFIIEQLKSTTPEKEIGVYVLDTCELFEMLLKVAQYQYKRTCSICDLEHLLINEFVLETNIIVIKDSINKNNLYIFYNNAANNEITALQLIKTWFNSYILKDFERKYKKSNNSTVRFSSSYEEEYNYLPIIRVLKELKIPLYDTEIINMNSALRYTNNNDVIISIISKLAKENGLKISKSSNACFTLEI